MLGSRMLRTALIWLVAVAALVSARATEPAAGAAHGLEVTYVGNEGFLLSAPGAKVLIDGLYRGGVSGYVVIPPEIREKIEGVRPPFDGIDLILATHHHADHFDANAVGAHLTGNPRGLFVSTEQAENRLRSNFAGFEAVRERVRGLHPAEGERVEIRTGKVLVHVLNLHHGRDRPVQNLGFLIEIGGMTLLHVGDTLASKADLDRHDLASERIDIAFLPFWYLEDDAWRTAVREAIRPEHIIVMHVPEPRASHRLGGSKKALRAIREAFPNSTVFAAAGESATFP